MGKLEGKVAVITGGSSGMALASAKRFVEEGAYVFIMGRRQEQLDEAVKLIGQNVTGVRGDAANLDDLDRLFDTVKQEKGKIDVLYASAGWGEAVPLGEITEQHFDAIFGLNSRGTLFTVQKALPLFNDGGSIFMTGSVASVKGFPGYGEQGGVALIRTHLAQRTEGREYPGERAEPGADRHTDAGPGSRRGGEADVRIPDPAGKDGSP
jgi:NAD(P)-dependent dehydrogenase (short-subunit alcohol dehydrogenase family)